MNHFLLPAYTIFVLLLGACANPNILTKRQSGDSAMSCDELGAAIGEAEELKKEARQEKGITGANVAAGLLFWPALLISYNNIGQAVDATNARISHLLEIGVKKTHQAHWTPLNTGSTHTHAHQPQCRPDHRAKRQWSKTGG
jgi:hypothetical protein